MDAQAIFAENKELKAQLAQVRFELEQLKRALFGSTTERFVPVPAPTEQLSLFAQPEAAQEPQEAAPEPVKETITYERDKAAARPHPGRAAIPGHFLEEVLVIEPEEDTEGLVKIGEERTEWVEYTPASLIKQVIIRPKYAKPGADCGTEILIGDLPSRPIDKSVAGASLLAHIAIAKYVDHLPFYRQIQRFSRDYGWQLHKSTVNSWFAASCNLLVPLHKVLLERTMGSDYLQADESKIKVLTSEPKGEDGKIITKKDKGASKQQLGWMWVVQDPLQGYVVFNYEDSRSAEAATKVLGGFKAGYLQTDGYASYNGIAARPGVHRLGCLAHVRRKFFDARGNDPTRADHALALFKAIYGHDDKARALEDVADRLEYRKWHMAPLYQRLKDWADGESVSVTPQSPIGKAITYLQNQWPNLRTLFMDGRLLIDNNLIENKIRPLALGRRNYLFAGSHEGARRAAMMYSFLATCKAQGVNPMEWLTFALQHIADTKISDLHTLLPGSTPKSG